MPIVILLLSLFYAFLCFGMILNAIDEHFIYWFPAAFFGFLAVMNFMKFLAMC